jgi:hypothetical protein
MTEDDINFLEWQQEQRKLDKAVRSGGTMTPIPAVAAGGAYIRPTGAPTDLVSGPSKYSVDPREGPQEWIDDVQDSDFFSPQQPMWPFGPPNITQPRAWDYPIGYNLNYVQARMESLRMFRAMARSWGVFSTIITTRQDQLMRIPWTIRRRTSRMLSRLVLNKREGIFEAPRWTTPL